MVAVQIPDTGSKAKGILFGKTRWLYALPQRMPITGLSNRPGSPSACTTATMKQWSVSETALRAVGFQLPGGLYFSK